VDIDSFSDVAPEIQKEVVSAVAAEPPATTLDNIISQSVCLQDEASLELTQELELTIHRGENSTPDAPLVEIREDPLEGHIPSPSLAAFNKSFGTSYRGELLSVGCEAADTGDGTSMILTLCKSSTLVNDTREGASEQTSHLHGGITQDSRKKPCTSSKRTSISSEQALVAKDKKGAPPLQPFLLLISRFSIYGFYFAILQNLKIFSVCSLRLSLLFSAGTMRQKPPYREGSPANV
jgi:hypothetical protein